MHEVKLNKGTDRILIHTLYRNDYITLNCGDFKAINLLVQLQALVIKSQSQRDNMRNCIWVFYIGIIN